MGPIDAAPMAAGPDAIRRSGPSQLGGLEAPAPKRGVPTLGDDRIPSTPRHPHDLVNAAVRCVGSILRIKRSRRPPTSGRSPLSPLSPKLYAPFCWPARARPAGMDADPEALGST